MHQVMLPVPKSVVAMSGYPAQYPMRPGERYSPGVGSTEDRQNSESRISLSHHIIPPQG